MEKLENLTLEELEQLLQRIQKEKENRSQKEEEGWFEACNECAKQLRYSNYIESLCREWETGTFEVGIGIFVDGELVGSSGPITQFSAKPKTRTRAAGNNPTYNKISAGQKLQKEFLARGTPGRVPGKGKRTRGWFLEYHPSDSLSFKTVSPKGEESRFKSITKASMHANNSVPCNAWNVWDFSKVEDI